jgi:hypothetical protein
MRSKSWSQTLSIQTIGTLRQNQRRSRMLCGGYVRTAAHEGIEANVQFIQLACEPTGESLDRCWAGHYRRRVDMGSASKAVYARPSPRSCAG